MLLMGLSGAHDYSSLLPGISLKQQGRESDSSFVLYNFFDKNPAAPINQQLVRPAFAFFPPLLPFFPPLAYQADESDVYFSRLQPKVVAHTQSTLYSSK